MSKQGRIYTDHQGLVGQLSDSRLIRRMGGTLSLSLRGKSYKLVKFCSTGIEVTQNVGKKPAYSGHAKTGVPPLPTA